MELVVFDKTNRKVKRLQEKFDFKKTEAILVLLMYLTLKLLFWMTVFGTFFAIFCCTDIAELIRLSGIDLPVFSELSFMVILLISLLYLSFYSEIWIRANNSSK